METESRLPNDAETQLQSLYKEMEPKNLYPLWEVLSSLVTTTPITDVTVTKWSYQEARDYLMRAGDLISAHDAERRVLILENPGRPGSSSITKSLYAGLQLILPGEVAPCHRHTQCALRFIMEGNGAFTAVDGEKAIMKPFDLILTPSWQWHDHGNPTDKPMIWLDGLDIPMVQNLDASFAEKLASGDVHEETVSPGDTTKRYGRNMRPMRNSSADRRKLDVPIFHYPYEEWRENLNSLSAAEAPDPHFGYAMEFTNPATGGSIMPTISAQVRLLPKGFKSKGRYGTDATIFTVVEGTGKAKIGDSVIDLADRDIFVVPTWHELILEAKSDLVLFGYSDRTAQEKLGLFKERLI